MRGHQGPALLCQLLQTTPTHQTHGNTCVQATGIPCGSSAIPPPLQSRPAYGAQQHATGPIRKEMCLASPCFIPASTTNSPTGSALSRPALLAGPASIDRGLRKSHKPARKPRQLLAHPSRRRSQLMPLRPWPSASGRPASPRPAWRPPPWQGRCCRGSPSNGHCKSTAPQYNR